VAPPQHADDPCFDGSPVGPEACPAEPPASKQQQQQQQQAKQRPRRQKGRSSQPPAGFVAQLLSMLPWKLKRRQRQQLATVIELVLGTAVAGLMAWAVVLVLKRVMKVGVRRRGPPCCMCCCQLLCACLLCLSPGPWTVKLWLHLLANWDCHMPLAYARCVLCFAAKEEVPAASQCAGHAGKGS
jgi:hypothetical protein